MLLALWRRRVLFLSALLENVECKKKMIFERAMKGDAIQMKGFFNARL